MKLLVVFLFSLLKCSTFFGVDVSGFLVPNIVLQSYHQHNKIRQSYSSLLLSSHQQQQQQSPKTTANNFIEEFFMSQQPSGVSIDKLRSMIKRCNLKENFTVIVTGATGGIGSIICESVLKLGGKIIAIDFNEEILMKWKSNQPNIYNDRIRIVTADFSDLNSVANAADSILKNQIENIDILVNNAGICYNLDDKDIDQAGVSKQGYDVCFQINYLSHFLLTEYLLEKMDPSTGRVVHVSSGLSSGVDGSRLIPLAVEKEQQQQQQQQQQHDDDNDNGTILQDPIASRGRNRLPEHISMAYMNSKLSQIWHSSHLNRLGLTTSVCACPSWAATGITGSEDGRILLEKFAFSTLPNTNNNNNTEEIAGPGVKSILNAMFLPKDEIDSTILKSQKVIGNSKVFDMICSREPYEPNPFLLSNNFITKNIFGRTNMVKLIASLLVLPLQRWNHDDLIFQSTSFECENENGQIELYKWSKKVVSKWLKKKEWTAIEIQSTETSQDAR